MHLVRLCLEVGLPIQIATKAASDTLHTLLYAMGGGATSL